MKKSYFFAALMLLVFVTANGMNTITMGDSIRINPKKLDGYSQHQVTMYNDGYCDSWTMAVCYPEGLSVKLVSGVTPLDGMTVPYVDRNGEEQVCTCPLNVSAAYANVSSSITTMGYWDYNYDGEWETYGTVKWAPGAHSMFEFNFYLDPSFRCGYVTFDGTMSSGYDQRGAVLQGVRFFSRTWVWVGYMRGDLAGNERIDMGDLTELINLLLGGEPADEFQTPAADFDGNGTVDMDDLTKLTNYLLTA